MYDTFIAIHEEKHNWERKIVAIVVDLDFTKEMFLLLNAIFVNNIALPFFYVMLSIHAENLGLIHFIVEQQ